MEMKKGNGFTEYRVEPHIPCPPLGSRPCLLLPQRQQGTRRNSPRFLNREHDLQMNHDHVAYSSVRTQEGVALGW